MCPLAARASQSLWSYDFVEDRTHDGRKFRMLNVLDEFTHESQRSGCAQTEGHRVSTF